MTKREALLRVLRRKDIDENPRMYPPDISLTPPKLAEFEAMHTGESPEHYFGLFHRAQENRFVPGYRGDGKYLFSSQQMPKEYELDEFGVGMSRGSEACMHMVHFHSPLCGDCSLEAIENYPLPSLAEQEAQRLYEAFKATKEQGLAAAAFMEQTIWERAWLIRGMEDLMVDMMTDDPRAEVLLERICRHSEKRAALFASSGADILFLGDDIGMQSTPLMDPDLWMRCLQPLLARVIQAAKRENREIIILYHSCGYVLPFIDGLIDAGVEVLNPIQPESMDVSEIYRRYHTKLAFWGGIGTQSTMPFGSPEEIKARVQELKALSSEHGGFVIAPTHIIEPEVPWENLEAYRSAFRTIREPAEG